MNISKLAVLSLALAGSLGAGLAQARTDVQWSVSIPGPIGISLYSQPYAVPGYTQPVVVRAPVYLQTGYGRGWGDRDHDGIPNRYDHRYNPRWDRDGDGIPNRHDTHYNPRGGDRHGQGAPSRGDDHQGRGERRDHGHDQGGSQGRGPGRDKRP